MKKLEIYQENGYLTFYDLPHNCIFNKVRTGCGATTIAIKNAENYVIAVPTTELITNKCHSSTPGYCKEVKIFGLYGQMTTSLEKELKEYLKSEGIKKIMCTYDKLPKVSDIVNPADFRLLVDEYHNFLKQYSFRDKAINGVLDHFKQYKSFCFMSATPIEDDLTPEILKDIPAYMADWKDIQQVKIIPYATNKPYQFITNIIEEYKINHSIYLNDQKSEEAYIFINSVTEIAKIIKECELDNSNCRVICADNSKNKKTLGDIFISNSLSKSKMFNFITSKSYEGADYASDTGLCFVVSNVIIKHTLASIDLDLPQIAGRIRNKNNPFKNMIIHIYNTKNDELFADYDIVKEEAQKEIEIAKERVRAFNQLSEEAKEQQKKEIKDSIYIRWGNDEFQVNDLGIKYHLYEYKLTHQIYSSMQNIKNAYGESGLSSSSIQWIKMDSKQIKHYGNKPKYKEIITKYYELKFAFDNSRNDLEKRYPLLRKGFSMFSYNDLLSFRSWKNLDQAIIQAELAKSPSREELFKLIKPHIEIGRFYQTAELKEICSEFHLKQIKELKEWFNLKNTTKRIDGISRSGYLILGLKMTPAI